MCNRCNYSDTMSYIATSAHVESIDIICIMVRGRTKGYRQCYKSFVTRLTTGCDLVNNWL